VALTSSEQEFRLLVDTIPTLVWSAGSDGNIDYVNKRALEYFGAPLSEIIGWGWTEKAHRRGRRVQNEDLARESRNPDCSQRRLQISRNRRPISVVRRKRSATESWRRPCDPMVRRHDRH
jgi:PAS domain S-box-containing protein